jgi:hypothetical protein
MQVIAVSLCVVAIAACAGPIALGEGRVTGIVGGWPAHPQGGDIAPEPSKVVLFVPESGGPTQSATSGSDGHYFIDLTPGQYEVRLSGFQPVGLLYGRDPKTYGQWPHVTVTEGTESKLDLIYDTGIR